MVVFNAGDDELILKENKEPGKQGHLIRMHQITESGSRVEYYQVVVKPVRNSEEVIFRTPFPLSSVGWNQAMTNKSVRLDR